MTKKDVTKLEKMRKRRGVTQDELAAAIGISRTTYQKLESGDDDNPRFRYLMNCAFALDCDVFDLIENEWRSWKIFDSRRESPPDPKLLWTPHDAG